MVLQVALNRVGAWAVAVAEGEVIAESAGFLSEVLQRALTLSPLIALDLSGATTTDAAGLAGLSDAHRGVVQRGGVFIVIAADRPTRRAIRTGGLAGGLVLCQTRQQFATWIHETGPAAGPPTGTANERGQLSTGA